MNCDYTVMLQLYRKTPEPRLHTIESLLQVLGPRYSDLKHEKCGIYQRSWKSVQQCKYHTYRYGARVVVNVPTSIVDVQRLMWHIPYRCRLRLC